jgi:hypothetical protein
MNHVSHGLFAGESLQSDRLSDEHRAAISDVVSPYLLAQMQIKRLENRRLKELMTIATLLILQLFISCQFVQMIVNNVMKSLAIARLNGKLLQFELAGVLIVPLSIVLFTIGISHYLTSDKILANGAAAICLVGIGLICVRVYMLVRRNSLAILKGAMM